MTPILTRIPDIVHCSRYVTLWMSDERTYIGLRIPPGTFVDFVWLHNYCNGVIMRVFGHACKAKHVLCGCESGSLKLRVYE